MLVPIAVIGGLVLLYIGSFLLNKHTPVPEELKELVDKTACESCHSHTCSYKD